MIVLVLLAAIIGMWWVLKRDVDDFNASGGIRPLVPCIQQMQEKDPELWRTVAPMTPAQAWRVWKDKYPEDFPEGGTSDAGSWHNIKPKARS